MDISVFKKVWYFQKLRFITWDFHEGCTLTSTSLDKLFGQKNIQCRLLLSFSSGRAISHQAWCTSIVCCHIFTEMYDTTELSAACSKNSSLRDILSRYTPNQKIQTYQTFCKGNKNKILTEKCHWHVMLHEDNLFRYTNVICYVNVIYFISMK